MKLASNTESATALRELAEAMPLAIDNIAESTEEVVQVYQSVAEDVGPHNQDFYNMIMLIKKAQEMAAEAVQALPPMLMLLLIKLMHTLQRILAFRENNELG